MTAAIAWLADHSDVFARGLCELFLEAGDQEARDALTRSSTVGADVQIRLPSIGAGLLWADMSLSGPKREFQLLIEVKLGSDFHEYPIPALGRTLLQPDAYLNAWRFCDPSHEARVRRLGTLTLDGEAPPHGDDRWRAGDITWGDVHQLLEDIGGDMPPEVGLVAQDLHDHLAGRILPPVVAPGFLDRGGMLTRGVCEHLLRRVVDGKLSGSFAAIERSQYAGGYLQFTSPEKTREKLWFIVTPAGGEYNVPGAPASIQITSVNEGPLTPAGTAHLIEAGFTYATDKAGYRLLRAALPLAEVESETVLDDQIAVASVWAEELLTAARFLPTNRTGA